MASSRKETRWQRAWPFIPASPPAAREEPQEAAEGALPLRHGPPGRRQADRPHPSEMRGVYIISVAARLLSMHPQTLRKYERVGFVAPNRTEGMLRLYSEEDITRLRLIKHLVDDLGLNLAGVELTLEVISRLLRLRLDLSETQDPAQAVARVTRELDAIFELVNLSHPRGQGQ